MRTSNSCRAFPTIARWLASEELGVTHVVVDARHMPEAAVNRSGGIPAAAPDVHRRLAAVVLAVETGAMSRARDDRRGAGGGCGVWLSTATLGFTGAAGVRLAILPLSVPVLLLAVAARRSRRRAPSCRRVAAAAVAARIPAAAVAAAVPAVGVSALGVAAVAVAVDCRADADGRLDPTRSRRPSARRSARRASPRA